MIIVEENNKFFKHIYFENDIKVKKMTKKELGQFYTTNHKYILQNLHIPNHITHIIEPFCGQGDLLKFVRENLSERQLQKLECYDILPLDTYIVKRDTLENPPNYNNKFVITNPPYSLAFEFILKAKQISKLKFAFLLPLYYLHGKKRYDEIFSDRSYGLEKIYVFTRSPMLGETLREDGKHATGMMPYAWYVWTNGYSGQPIIDWLDNNDDILTKKDLTENLITDIFNL